jgi:hypothetical protein
MDFSKYWNMHSAIMIEHFRVDAMKELALIGHEKAEWIWGMAWKHGHAYGFKEVFFQMRDLKKMLMREAHESNRRLN